MDYSQFRTANFRSDGLSGTDTFQSEYFPCSSLSSGAADTALAEPSGAGGGASAHSPQSANYVGNVSVRRSVVNAYLVRSFGRNHAPEAMAAVMTMP